MREKFAVTKAASSAKKYRCRPAELMRSLKRAAHKRQRRKISQAFQTGKLMGHLLMNKEIIEAQFEDIEQKQKPFRTESELRAARRLLRFRTEKGLTQAQLSSKLTITRTTVVNWESGNFPISIAHLTDISKVLGRHISDFFVEDI